MTLKAIVRTALQTSICFQGKKIRIPREQQHRRTHGVDGQDVPDPEHRMEQTDPPEQQIPPEAEPHRSPPLGGSPVGEHHDADAEE